MYEHLKPPVFVSTDWIIRCFFFLLIYFPILLSHPGFGPAMAKLKNIFFCYFCNYFIFFKFFNYFFRSKGLISSSCCSNLAKSSSSCGIFQNMGQRTKVHGKFYIHIWFRGAHSVSNRLHIYATVRVSWTAHLE